MDVNYVKLNSLQLIWNRTDDIINKSTLLNAPPNAQINHYKQKTYLKKSQE